MAKSIGSFVKTVGYKAPPKSKPKKKTATSKWQTGMRQYVHGKQGKG